MEKYPMSRKPARMVAAVSVSVGALAGLSAGSQWVGSTLNHDPALGWRLIMGDGRNGTHLYLPWQWLIWRSSWPADLVIRARVPFQQAFVLGCLGVSLGLLPPALLRGTGAARERPSRELGKGRWATRKEIAAARLINSPCAGTVVGQYHDTRESTILSFAGIEHQLVIGPSRSGKGVGHVIPTLFIWAGSCICYDVKGELWRTTAARRKVFGQVLFWNPTRPDTARYNPLLEVRRNHATGDVQKIAKMLINSGGNRADDDIWERSAEQLLVAIMLHVLYTEADEAKHLGRVREKVLDLTNTLIDMLELPHQISDDGKPQVHPEIQRVAASFADKTTRFRSSVAGTLEAFLTIFADEHVVHATSACDFRMSDLACAEKAITLYVQVPPADIERLRPLTRLIVDQACRVLLHNEETDAWGRPKRRDTLMMLDEFPSLGRIEAFANHMKLMASFRLKGFLVVQSVNDIIGTYGPHNTIIDNSHLVVAFATADVTSLERISRMTGTVREYRESYSRPDRLFSGGRRSINESETVQPLLTPGDVRELPSDQQLILINGTKPIRTSKFIYHEHELMASFVRPPPDQAATVDAPPRWKSEWDEERAKGERLPHPLAARLREELKAAEGASARMEDYERAAVSTGDRSDTHDAAAPPEREPAPRESVGKASSAEPVQQASRASVVLSPELQRRRALL